MGILKRKDERSATVTVRVPSSVKAEIDRLRSETEAAGFDLNATFSEAVMRVTRQIREELERLSSRPSEAGRKLKANGLGEGSGAA
jgi:hypothetical protein